MAGVEDVGELCCGYKAKYTKVIRITFVCSDGRKRNTMRSGDDMIYTKLPVQISINMRLSESSFSMAVDMFSNCNASVPNPHGQHQIF